MIRGNVTVCGVIDRAATLKTNKKGEPFTSFSIKLNLPQSSGGAKACWISVSKDAISQEELRLYTPGIRVEIQGGLSFHKDKEQIYLNLSANSLQQTEYSRADQLTGELDFYGVLGNAPETRTDKKGNPYICFSAYSSEMVGEERAFTWVRFIQFSKNETEILAKGNHVHITGTLDVQYYNSKLNLNSRIKSIEPWEKKNQPDLQ